MEKFTVLNGLVAPLDRANVDTDQIIPKEYLKSIKRTGYAEGLFAAWRHDPQFMLNRPQYKGATILMARKNFGCGSSREYAPWALMDYGFRCVIAPSFADIFYNNCFENGLLPVTLPDETVKALMAEARGGNHIFSVDLESQTVTTPTGEAVTFEIDPGRKEKLIKGLDAIGETLEHEGDITRYEAKRAIDAPWLEARA